MNYDLTWWQWLLLAVWGPTTVVALAMMASVATRATTMRIRQSDGRVRHAARRNLTGPQE